MLRSRMLKEKVLTSTTFVNPERFVNTEDALKYHSFRCYHQIMKWMGIKTTPEEWGWYSFDNILYPKIMDKKCAPDSLLKIIHCNCKSDCTTKRCSCRKNGLRCTYVCRPCQTDGCCNADVVEDPEDP